MRFITLLAVLVILTQPADSYPESPCVCDVGTKACDSSSWNTLDPRSSSNMSANWCIVTRTGCGSAQRFTSQCAPTFGCATDFNWTYCTPTPLMVPSCPYAFSYNMFSSQCSAACTSAGLDSSYATPNAAFTGQLSDCTCMYNGTLLAIPCTEPPLSPGYIAPTTGAALSTTTCPAPSSAPISCLEGLVVDAPGGNQDGGTCSCSCSAGTLVETIGMFSVSSAGACTSSSCIAQYGTCQSYAYYYPSGSQTTVQARYTSNTAILTANSVTTPRASRRPRQTICASVRFTCTPALSFRAGRPSRNGTIQRLCSFPSLIGWNVSFYMTFDTPTDCAGNVSTLALDLVDGTSQLRLCTTNNCNTVPGTSSVFLPPLPSPPGRATPAASPAPSLGTPPPLNAIFPPPMSLSTGAVKPTSSAFGHRSVGRNAAKNAWRIIGVHMIVVLCVGLLSL